MTERLLVEASDGVLRLTFNRPGQHNAMTWDMYEGLYEACERADQDDKVRVLVLRGAGGRAFVSGTDIGQFRGFTGADGVAYERSVDRVLGRLAAVEVPVVAAIDGYCVGSGFSIAAQADLRIAHSSASLGVPIARTLGNCLSARTLDSLVRLLGRARTTELLLTGQLMTADAARDAGFLTTVTQDVDAELDQAVHRLLSGAPLTMWATKQTLRRLAAGRTDDDDILTRVYGSQDFAGAVDSFLAKKPPSWRGR